MKSKSVKNSTEEYRGKKWGKFFFSKKKPLKKIKYWAVEIF